MSSEHFGFLAVMQILSVRSRCVSWQGHALTHVHVWVLHNALIQGVWTVGMTPIIEPMEQVIARDISFTITRLQPWRHCAPLICSCALMMRWCGIVSFTYFGDGKSTRLNSRH